MRPNTKVTTIKTMLNLARVNLLKERFDEAEKVARNVLRVDIKNEDAKRVLAEVAVRRKNPELAAVILSSLDAYKSKDADLLNLVGLTKVQQGKRQEAVYFFKQAVKAGQTTFSFNDYYKKFKKFGDYGTILSAWRAIFNQAQFFIMWLPIQFLPDNIEWIRQMKLEIYNTYRAASVFTPDRLSGAAVAQFSEVAGRYIRVPVTILLGVFSYLMYVRNVKMRYRKTYSMDTLAVQESDLWPQIKPVVGLNIVKTNADKGPWAMSMPPVKFCKHFKTSLPRLPRRLFPY